jgi:pimeloyl-ACP methyl ester carboxylesterase
MMDKGLLNYKSVGVGHPVLFLHGFLESISMWKGLDMENYGFMGVLIDLPGHGNSCNKDSAEPSIEYMAEKVLELADHLGFTSFSVVGHSMGGYVALAIKKRCSSSASTTQECKRVILLHSNFWEDSALKKTDRLRVASIVYNNKALFIKEAVPNLFLDRRLFQREIDELVEEALKIDHFAIAYASLAMRNRLDMRNLLVKFPEDFLLIQGEKDAIVPLEMMQKQLEGLPIRLEILWGVGHMSHIEAPEKIQKILNWCN